MSSLQLQRPTVLPTLPRSTQVGSPTSRFSKWVSCCNLLLVFQCISTEIFMFSLRALKILYLLTCSLVTTTSRLIQVAIQAELEKKIIKLINDFIQENGDKGPVSGRLTSKKLLVKKKKSFLWFWIVGFHFGDTVLYSGWLSLDVPVGPIHSSAEVQL